MKPDDLLKLENQICFPLYAASRLVTQCYQPVLARFNITYPQYLVLLVLWEKDNVNLTFIADKLQLKSNTLTPLLKRMEELQLIERKRSSLDERNISIALTEKGKNLKQEAVAMPMHLISNLELSRDEMLQLHHLLYKLIDQFKAEEEENIPQ